MDDSKGRKFLPPLGAIEPHAELLKRPDASQLLYKSMSVEHLLASIAGAYMHFNRVDSYSDFAGADVCDGQQLPRDQEGNARSTFAKAPTFSAADYYDKCRARTYACCFSADNSNYTWRNYGGGGTKGRVCLVFQFGNLRARINRTFETRNTALNYRGMLCHQVFSVKYGLVEYVDWNQHQQNTVYLPNPIQYIYLKDRRYAEESEVRISLSAIGIGTFVLKDGTPMELPPSLQLAFDFHAAILDGTIPQILYLAGCDWKFLLGELKKCGIEPSELIV